MQVPEGVQRLVEALGPNRFVQAAAIVLAALVLAFVADLVVTKVLRRVAGRTRTSLDDRVLAAIHGPLRVVLVLAGLGLAVARLGLGETLHWLTTGILKTVAVLVIAGFVTRLSELLVDALSGRATEEGLLQTRTVPLFANVIRVLIFGAAVYFLFLAWSIDVTAWLLSAGVIGIAVGFAAKDTLANLFSGVFILVDAPYKVADYVVLDTGERGRITHIGLRSTRMLTRDDVEVTIPNAVIANAKIINESGGPSERERIRVPVGVSYGSDIDLVRRVLMQVAGENADLVGDPEPRVRFRAFGASSLDFELLAWIAEPEQRGRVLDALHCAVYHGFRDAGIEIPFPQRDLHVKTMPPGLR
jgi:small-conductance mechanosensitive channel